MENLYRRVEQTLGIRAAGEALEKLRNHLEQQYGPDCFAAPDFYERILSFPEDIFTAARLLTINETYFFREEAHFELFRQELLPRLGRLNRPIRICSAATSIGCEAYSLAMAADDYSRTVHPLRFGIDAFDINPEAIATAKKGRYTENSLRDDGARWKSLLDRYTRPEGPDFTVDPLLQARVRFYTHNLLDGLMGNRYDLIFFRNAFIYFSADKRVIILDRLAEALFNGAFLVLGASETPAVSHPLLESQYARDAFYFRKVPAKTQAAPREGPPIAADPPLAAITSRDDSPVPPARPAGKSPSGSPPAHRPRKKALISPPEPEEIAVLIADHAGGYPIAEKLPELLREAAEKTARRPEGNNPEFSGNDLFAGVIYLLGQENFSGTDKLLSFIEAYHPSAFTYFLRGEYHYFKQQKKEAEASYKEAAGKNDAFWPAFYRLCILAAEGNPVQYAYKIRKALESIQRGKDFRYEVFIGGFSPDYYRRTLEKRLS
jgi:chemotaxis protein methyltransferase CheR